MSRSCLVPRRARILLLLLLTLVPGSVRAQKTDVVTLRNGDRVTVEIQWLSRGLLELKTDGLKTVYAQWPKVLTINTDKHFYIEIEDGTLYFGSLEAGTADSVIIHTDSVQVTVQTQAIVWLQRLKATFWSALDGDIDLGIAFTQQNAKTDLSLSGEIRYPRQANQTKLSFDTRFSRQDDTDNIVRLDGTLLHARQLKERWFFLGFGAGARNSQLSLEGRATLGGGFGRALVESNKVNLLAWIAPAVSWEQYAGEPGNVVVPLVLASEFLYFVWDSRNTDISSELAVMPMLNDLKRWRFSFTLSLSRELVKDFYVRIAINELFDSRPPAIDVNKNDFSFTTSFGWSF